MSKLGDESTEAGASVVESKLPFVADEGVSAASGDNQTELYVPRVAHNDIQALVAPTRFLTYNVYYANLAWRAHEVARGIAQVAPEIASLQETVQDRTRILEELIRITGQQWSLSSPPGGCLWYWDGAIIFRSDLWEELENGRTPYGGGGCYSESLRALNWVALRRRADGKGLLVYGTHPIC